MTICTTAGRRARTLCPHPLAAAIILACAGLAPPAAGKSPLSSLPVPAAAAPDNPPPAPGDATTDPADADAGGAGAPRLATIEVEGQATPEPVSPKFTAPLLDTPQTVAVIPRDVFAAQGARNLTEVLRNTPGISFNAGENGFASSNANFSLRGFDASGSIFIDGVRDSGNHMRDVFNLEQVEVVKGAAADNGRGGLSGYVNLVSKTPQAADFVHAGASFGGDGTDAGQRVRTTLDANRQLGAGAAVRLNLLAQDGGVPGREHAHADAVGIAPAISFGLDGDTRLSLSAQYLDQGGRPDWGVPGAMIPGTVNHDPVAAGAAADSYFGLLGDYDSTLAKAATAHFEHAFRPGLVLASVLRWSSTEREALYTLPFGYDPANALVTGQSQAYQRRNLGLGSHTSLVAAFATGPIEHSLASGLELSRERSDALRFGSQTPPPTPVLDPDPRRADPVLPAAQQRAAVAIDTVAVYLHDTLRLGERWQLTGGVRVEHYTVDVDSRTLADDASQGPDGYHVSETTLGGKLGLVYKPAAQGSLYAAVSTSTLPPGAWLSNPDISRTGNNAFPGLVGQNNQAAKPQRAVNHELGIKWNFFQDRLATSAALFETTRRGVAISGKEPGEPDSPTLLRGYGRQVVRGVELAVTGNITPAWTVFAGAVLLDSEREHDPWLDAARREANPGDYGDAQSTRGDELAFTPRRSASLWTSYRFDNGLTVGGGVQHVGESWAGRPDDADRILPNGRFGKLPGHTVTQLMVAWEVNPHLRLRLNLDNAGDRLYATSGNWPMTRVFLGPARNWLLSADLRF